MTKRSSSGFRLREKLELGRRGEVKRQINTFRRSERAGTRDQERAILQLSRIGMSAGAVSGLNSLLDTH